MYPFQGIYLAGTWIVEVAWDFNVSEIYLKENLSVNDMPNANISVLINKISLWQTFRTCSRFTVSLNCSINIFWYGRRGSQVA